MKLALEHRLQFVVQQLSSPLRRKARLAWLSFEQVDAVALQRWDPPAVCADGERLNNRPVLTVQALGVNQPPRNDRRAIVPVYGDTEHLRVETLPSLQRIEH